MAKKNFTITTVATAPSPATSGTSLVVAAGTGSLFALNEPAIIFPVNDQPLVANAEIVMVTNVATDTLTITRTQESTSARTIVEGDIIIQGITAKDWNDLITLVSGKITAFADPNADRIVFWDDSAGAFAALTASTGLTLSGTNLTVRAASETATGIVERATDAEFTSGTDTTRFINAKQVASVAQTMTNKTLISPVIDTGVSGTAILDEDDMASNSATQLATQQSIKAYVDSKGFTWKGAWATSTAYAVNDTVESNGSGYVCTSAHTSGSTTEAGVGASWSTVWDLFVEGVSGNSLQVDQSGGTSDTYGVLSGLVNSSNKVYTVSLGSYISGSLSVYLNGQLQTQGSSEDWVETAPASGTFTFATAPTTGDIITAVYQFSTGSTGNADTLDGSHGTAFVKYADLDTDLSSVSASDDTVPSAKATKSYVDAGKTGASYVNFVTSDATTTSATGVQVGSAQVTITTKGGAICMMGSAMLSNNTNSSRLTFDVDGTVESANSLTNSSTGVMVNVCVYKAIAAGSHTIKLVYYTQAGGTAKLHSYNSFSLMVWEL